MKLGIVKHLNARPLTYGFEKSGKYELYYDNPSILKEELLKGNLDIALISSVECIRNIDSLDFSLSTGVCASKKVRSILFFENKNKQDHKIFVDEGSRSSVALLKILYKIKYGSLPETIPHPPASIQTMIHAGIGSHLLFGDNALLSEYKEELYTVRDLAEWWNQSTGLNFIFALWAYPKALKPDEQLFYSSLEYGLQNIEEIMLAEKRFSKELMRTYLQNELHYVVTEKDKAGFQKFAAYSKEFGLL